jgi:hypothetical protein
MVELLVKRGFNTSSDFLLNYWIYSMLFCTMNKVPTRVNGRFRLGDVLGSGSYGT